MADDNKSGGFLAMMARALPKKRMSEKAQKRQDLGGNSFADGFVTYKPDSKYTNQGNQGRR